MVLFSVEYLLRLWSSAEGPDFSGRLHWAIRPLALIDLAAIIPFVVDLTSASPNGYQGLSLIRLLRVFSLFKMERSFQGFARIANVLYHKREELVVTAFLAFIMLILSASIMYYIEHLSFGPRGDHPPSPPPQPGSCEDPTPPQFSSITWSLWWSVAALTTTGYGDMVPHSAAGKAFGGVIGFVGVIFFALPAGIIGSGFTEVLLDAKQRRARPPGGTSTRLGCATSGSGSCVSPHDGLEAVALNQALRALQTGQISLASSILEERLASLQDE